MQEVKMEMNRRLGIAERTAQLAALMAMIDLPQEEFIAEGEALMAGVDGGFAGLLANLGLDDRGAALRSAYDTCDVAIENVKRDMIRLRSSGPKPRYAGNASKPVAYAVEAARKAKRSAQGKARSKGRRSR